MPRKASTFVAELRRKSDLTSPEFSECARRGGRIRLWLTCPPADAARPRSCALRLRRFSRSAAARRRLRPAGFSVLLSSFHWTSWRHYRCPGSRCNPSHCLAPAEALWQFPPRSRRFISVCARSRCRSSVVEHPLGKGEVHSSILSGSTKKTQQLRVLKARRLGRDPKSIDAKHAARVRNGNLFDVPRSKSGLAKCGQRTKVGRRK